MRSYGGKYPTYPQNFPTFCGVLNKESSEREGSGGRRAGQRIKVKG
jgi:hypothetical protein